MLERVLERVSNAEFIDKIVLATPHRLPIYCAVSNFIGSENDVLDRYYKCAKKFKADIIVRLTADCPLISPELIDYCILTLVFGNYDFVSSRVSYPDGFDVEVFTFKCLERTFDFAEKKEEREHVTPYMIGSPLFKKCFIKALQKNNGKYSVDTLADLERVRKIYRKGQQDKIL